MDGPTLTLLLVQLGLILAIPLCMAKLLERLALSPLVLELLCGVMLGPSVFGMVAPDLFARVFPALGRATQAREAVTELGLHFAPGADRPDSGDTVVHGQAA